MMASNLPERNDLLILYCDEHGGDAEELQLESGHNIFGD